MRAGGHLSYRAELRDKRVLVVEDEALVAMMLEDELLEAGAEVVGPASSVSAALELIDATATDGGLSAAVLDINLNGERVSPVADRLAALGVPFLFATGYLQGCDTGGHGTAPLLQKPFSSAALIAAVGALTPNMAGRRRHAPQTPREPGRLLVLDPA